MMKSGITISALKWATMVKIDLVERAKPSVILHRYVDELITMSMINQFIFHDERPRDRREKVIDL